MNINNLRFNLIGISGVAGSGKDSFARLIGESFNNLGYEVKYLSFAKKLKQEVSRISKQLYGIDTTNCTRDEKNLIRPLLLAHGAIMRAKTDGRYWIDSVNSQIEKDKINIITDVRFCEYKSDEVSFIKKENKGIVVHVSRYTEFEGERQMIKPDNEYELRNDKKLIELSDYSFSWPTNLSLQKKYCNNFIKWIDNNYVGI